MTTKTIKKINITIMIIVLIINTLSNYLFCNMNIVADIVYIFNQILPIFGKLRHFLSQ